MRRGDRLLGRHIDCVTECGNGELVADVGGDLRRFLPVQVEDHDGPALTGIPAGDSDADAAFGGGAGDDGGALGVRHVHFSLLDEVGNQVCGRGGSRGPLVVGDVAGFQFQGEVAGVSGIGQRLEPRRSRPAPLPTDRLMLPDTASRMCTCAMRSAKRSTNCAVAARGHDVAEIHHNAHRAAGQPVAHGLPPLGVPAQPVVVQRLGPQLDTVVVRPVGRADEFGGDEVEVVLQRAAAARDPGSLTAARVRGRRSPRPRSSSALEVTVPLDAARRGPATAFTSPTTSPLIERTPTP